MRFLMCAALVLVVMIACDAVWLGTTMTILYRPAMRTLLATDANLVSAAGFYLLYALALSYVVIQPLIAGGRPLDWTALVLRSAVFGLAAYGTYDLTGLSVIRDWPAGLSLIDMAWGTVNTVISASVAVLCLGRLRRLT